MAPFNGVPTHPQQVALALVPKFAAALSIFGSGYIALDVLRGRRRESRGLRTRGPYQRLMLGMSASDLMMSGGIFMSTWPMPSDVPNVWGNVGTVQTCTAQGFFEQFGVTTVMYSASLSIHYLITIKYGRFNGRKMLQRAEPWLHAVPWTFGLVTAVASLGMQLFNYGLWDCWIAPSPQGCDESWKNNGATSCVRGDNASLYQWLFDLIPKWTSILIVTEQVAQKWSERSSQYAANVSRSQRSSARSHGTSQQGSQRGNPRSSVASLASSTGTSARRSRRDSVSLSRQIAHQSYLYVGALWITWLPVMILRGTQLAAGVTYYWMLIWVAFSIPLQGFWNVLVYLRPRWVQKRKDQKEKRIVEEERRLQESSPEGGGGGRGTHTNKAVSYFRDFSVAAVDALREGDVSEISTSEGAEATQTSGGGGRHDVVNLAPVLDATKTMEEEGRSDRAGSVTFASRLVTDSDVERHNVACLGNRSSYAEDSFADNRDDTGGIERNNDAES